MEEIRRSIKLFFTTYGNLLFRIIGGILIFLFVLRGIDYIYSENTNPDTVQTSLFEEEMQQKEGNTKKVNEDKLFISKFLDYCNEGKIQEAYKMLSKECISEKYQTVEKFKNDYINKIFTHKKDYKIEGENSYRVIIIDGILESGSVKNRRSIECYYRIDEDVLEKAIYIER